MNIIFKRLFARRECGTERFKRRKAKGFALPGGSQTAEPMLNNYQYLLCGMKPGIVLSHALICVEGSYRSIQFTPNLTVRYGLKAFFAGFISRFLKNT